MSNLNMIRTLGAMTLLSSLFLCAASCSKEDSGKYGQMTSLTVRSEIVPMENSGQTKVSIDGSTFLTDDIIRLKVVTPYDRTNHSAEYGESSWGATADNYFLLRWDGAWTTGGFGKYAFDFDGDGKTGDGAPSLQYLSQQTPYVFTADSWSRCVGFKTDNKWRVAFKSVFYADQSIEENFRASDLLWAQSVTQTCTDEVTLCFHHVLCELLVSIPAGLSDPVLTLEGMPDIDQKQIVVGNRYANADICYGQSLSFSTISYVSDASENGKAIGVQTLSADSYQLKRFSDIDGGATYTAYKADAGTFRIIVAPGAVSADSRLVLRDGTKKYVYPLSGLVEGNTFLSGTCYPVTLKIE